EQGTDQRKGKKFRKLPTVNGAPAENGQSAQEKVEKNNPAVSNQNAPSGNQKKLRRNQVQSSGQATVTGPSGQGAVSPNANVRNRSLRKPPNAGGGSAGGEANVQQNFKANKPNENARRQFKQEKQVLSPQRPEFQAQPKPRPRMQERRLQQQPRPQPQVQERRLPQEQPRPQMQERRPPREQPRPQMQERRPPQEQARPQMQERRPPQEQPRPQMQERRPPQEQRRPQIQERRPPQEQPRPQMQERRPSQTQPKPQQQEKKKPSCGQPGEPACGK
ncbi:hypothetical protein RFN28_31420, partial [Mesorhizobium sp. VK24D]|nr:hypothetical protein [Mesorhizobium sp. VK24D]